MPAGDGTGPMGMGPMTGRRMGYCAGYGLPGYANPAAPRLGLGWWHGWGGGGWGGRAWGGRGGGRGRRYQYYATGAPGWARYGYAPAWGPAPTAAQEVEILKSQAEWLKEQLDAIGKRIEELEHQE